MLPVRKSPLRANAPSSPVSSEVVKRHSILPCGSSLSSRTASWAAIPIPQSAPSVVSLAMSQPFSTTALMGSFEKSCSTPLFFSQTMSEWLCRMTVGEFSLPGVAGMVMSTLPASSVLQSRCRSAANFWSQAIICSSCPDSRGMVSISRKWDSTCSEVMAVDIRCWILVFSLCRRRIA